MIAALRNARRVSRAALGLGVIAAFALTAHLAVDAPASSASTNPSTTRSAPATPTQSTTSSSGTSSSSSSSSSSTFSTVPPVGVPSATQPTHAQSHSS